MLAVALVACTRPKRTFDMTWTTAVDAACGAEPKVELRFVKAPKYFVTFCSSKLATTLTSGGKAVVPVVIRGGSDSFSVCEIAGLKNDAPNTECTFQGLSTSGYDCVAARDGACGGPNANKPTPWD